MTQTEALKLALEALKNSQYRFAEYGYQAMQKTIDGNKEAITAIKAALEAKDEPVAWMYPDDLKRFETSETFAQAYSIEVVSPTHGETVPLYTTPPQRKPLTDDQIYEMYNEPRSDAEMLEFARAIEAAHNIKGQA